MEGFLILIFVMVPIVVLLLVLSSAQSRATDRAWGEAARLLGWQVLPTGLGSPRRIQGVLPTGPVQVDTFVRRSGKHSRTYTRYRAEHARSLGLGLRITRENFLGGIGKLFGAQDIQIDEPTFDNMALVKGNRPEAVTRFLTPERQEAIRRALSSYPGLAIDDHEVCWEAPGLHRDPSQMANNIRDLSALAWLLSGAIEEDHGDVIEEAASVPFRLDGIDFSSPPGPTEPELLPPPLPVETTGLEGLEEFLEIRKPEDAAEPGAPAWLPPLPEQVPPVPEAPQGALEAPARPAEPQSVRPEPQPAPPPVPPASLPSAGAATRQDAPVLLDAAAVCEDLFRSGQTSFDVSRTFEERYQDRRVSWRGTLASVDTYSIDFAFGPEAGARATLDVHEIGGDAYGAARIQAIVRIPASAAESLRDARGSRIAFEGRLVRADSLLRQLYVADGRIVGSPA